MLAGRRALCAHAQVHKGFQLQSVKIARPSAPAGVSTCCASAAPSRRAATTNQIPAADHVYSSRDGSCSTMTARWLSGSLALGRRSSRSTPRRVATAATASAPGNPPPSQPSQPAPTPSTSNQSPVGGASSAGATSSGPLYPTPQSELTLHSLLNTGARLTAAAQAAWAQVLRPGDTAVDATCGNGHDTLFLAQAVGPTGAVHAVDIQEAALVSTRARLEAGLAPEQRPAALALHRACHSRLQELVGSNVARVVAFNLGYLPSGDKALTTNAATSVAAVEAALEVVVPGGLVSILAYIGHPGGLQEYEAVKGLIAELSPSYWVVTETRLLNRPTAPILLLLWRREDVGPGIPGGRPTRGR